MADFLTARLVFMTVHVSVRSEEFVGVSVVDACFGTVQLVSIQQLNA